MPILDLTESNPTRAGLSYPAEIVEALADSRGAGLRSAACRIDRGASRRCAAITRRRGHTVEPENRVLLTASTSEAYAYLFKLLADPGDEVLAPRPSYPLFEFLASYGIAARGPLSAGLSRRLVDRLRCASRRRDRSHAGHYRGELRIIPPDLSSSRTNCDFSSASAGRAGWRFISDEVFADYAFAEDARPRSDSWQMRLTPWRFP